VLFISNPKLNFLLFIVVNFVLKTWERGEALWELLLSEYRMEVIKVGSMDKV
jgi:hypothetical protein